MMCGYLAGMAVFGAVIRDNIPENKAGMFQGLRIIGQVLIPGIIGPWIGNMVLRNAETIVNNDGTTSFIPNENIFLAALIVAVIVLAFLLIISLKSKKDNKN
jgi:MFS family permease